MSEGSTNDGCPVCDDLDTSHTDRWQVMRQGLGYQRVAKYFDLRETASRGCEICSIVCEGVEAFQNVLGHIGEESIIRFRCRPPLYPLQVCVEDHKQAKASWLEFFTLGGE